MKSKSTVRRTAMIAVLGFLLGFVLFGILGADGVQTDAPALKDVFAKDFYVGCILSYTHVGFPDDPPVAGQAGVQAPQGGYLVTHHMNSMTPGNWMKMMLTLDTNASAAAVKAADDEEKEYAETHPVVVFGPNLVAQLDWAKRNGFTFRGHALVWPTTTPAELFKVGFSHSAETVSKEVALKRLENYIAEVFRKLHEGWPGLLSAMDVVNEAVDDSGNPRKVRNPWYEVFGGDSYVMKAFEFARKYTKTYGETQIKLYYNDYNTASPAKADGIVKLCKPIFAAGYLDGIGMQEHDNIDSPSAAAWIASYNKFAPICREMAVTELDVSTKSGTNTPPPEVLEKQANQYAMLFKLFLERSARSKRGKIVSVTKDGLNDQYTFKSNQSSSLWDANYQCKPAFFAVVDMANNYRELSSLLDQARKLTRKNFKAPDWKTLTATVKSAREALAKNYSRDESAAAGLGEAVKSLKAAMKLE